MAGKSYKQESHQSTIADAISDGITDLQGLRDEMREWADNMSSNNMEHLPKYEEVGAAADALDNFVDNDFDVPEFVQDRQITVSISVKRSRKESPSRAVRLDNAIAYLETAKEELETRVEELKGEIDDLDTEEEGSEAKSEALDNQITDIETLTEELQNAIDEAMGVEFPGMF